MERDGCRKAVEFIRRETGLEVEVIRDGGPVWSDAADPLMARLTDVMRKTWNDPKLAFATMSGATDARHFGGLGLPVAIVGSESGGAHTDDEWADIGGLERLRTALATFLGERD